MTFYLAFLRVKGLKGNEQVGAFRDLAFRIVTTIPSTTFLLFIKIESLSLAYTQGEGNWFLILERKSSKETVDIYKTAQFTVWPQTIYILPICKIHLILPKAPEVSCHHGLNSRIVSSKPRGDEDPRVYLLKCVP